MNILGIGWDKSQSYYLTGGTPGARIRDGEGLGGGHTTWPRDQAWPAPGGGLADPSTPSASPSAYKLPPIQKP